MAVLKTKYDAEQTLTCTLASLASSTTKVAGRSSAAFDNTTTRALDCLLSGKITTGTSPTVNRTIQIWIYPEVDNGGSPAYPDVFDGTDANDTVTSENVRNSALRLAATINVDSNSNRTYGFGPVSIASLFGGVMPEKWGVWVVHDTGVALNSTGSNHALWVRPVWVETV